MAKQTTVNTVKSKPISKVKTKSSGPGFLEKNALKIAIAFAIIALCLRLYRIGFLSLWVDEYMHALAAIKGQFKHGENNGILLTWLNTICAYIFGHNEFAMRFPVALMGAALVPVTYVLAKNIAGWRVALMSAVFVCFSLYLLFWSRVDRPYGMVATFYLPLLLCFWLMLERKPAQEGFWYKFGIHPKYLLFTLIALVLSMLSQLICFLFIFSAGFYGSLTAIDSWISKTSHPLKLNAYNLLFYLNILAVVFMLTPIGNTMMKPLIEIFLPGNMANLILPDVKAAIAALDGEKAYKSYETYIGVINGDFKLLNILGWLGFFLPFFNNRKLSYFLISGFVVPFILMSFIFRDPSHAKYLSYIYPVFLISAAYTLYYIAYHLMPKVSKSLSAESKSYSNALIFIFLILTLGITKKDEIKAVLTTEQHGNIVDNSISEIHFVNWKQPCLFIKEKMQKEDVVMATVQFAPRFYLGLDSVVWFRQMHYDALKKDYVPNLPDQRKRSALTFEQLVKTFNENPRGWLLADYYFDNALTDPRAKEFVEQNFVYHFNACDDGAVKVFSWDKSKPKDYRNSFVIEMGKNKNQMGSQPMSINLNLAAYPQKINLVFLSEGIDSDFEAVVQINDSKQVPIKANGNAAQKAQNLVQVDKSIFKEGMNKIQFFYNGEEGNGDLIKGCVIYSMDIR